MRRSPLPPRDDDQPASPPDFHVDLEPDRDVVRVCPVGEVDLATVDEIRASMQEVRSAGFTRILLDLRGATFLDSTGLRLVVEAQSSSAANGWEFGVIEGPDEVQRAFEIAGLRTLVRFVDASRGQNGRWH